MRMLSLALFAVLALVIGGFKEDGMTLLIGVASGLAAVASLPRWKMSTFLTLLCELFAVETVLFGLADLVALTGYWPHSWDEYQLPTYLPLATALFILAIFAVSHFRLVRKMMTIADPFFAARTPISIRPLPSQPIILRQDIYARINVFFLILINQFQVALALRFNFFQRDFGNAIQVADEAHRVAFWYQLMVVFVPLATIAIVAGIVEFFVASNFVLQWRRWMTASFTSRWLMHSMHYKLALSRQRRQQSQPTSFGRIPRSARPNRQPRSAHFAGHRRLHQRHRDRHQFRQRRHLQLHHPGDRFRDQSGLVLDHPVGNFQLPQRADFRDANPWLPVLGRGPIRLPCDRHHPAHRPKPVQALLPPAGGRGELPLRSRAHPRIQRTDRASQGRGSRDRPRRQRVWRGGANRFAASSMCAPG